MCMGAVRPHTHRSKMVPIVRQVCTAACGQGGKGKVFLPFSFSISLSSPSILFFCSHLGLSLPLLLHDPCLQASSTSVGSTSFCQTLEDQQPTCMTTKQKKKQKEVGAKLSKERRGRDGFVLVLVKQSSWFVHLLAQT